MLSTQPAFAQTNTFPTTGDVGIGTTSPTVPLQVTGNVAGGVMLVENSTYPVAIVQRNDTGATGILTDLNLVAKTTNTISGEYGPILGFWSDDALGNYDLAFIGAVTDSGKNGGHLVFDTYTSGTQTERMRIMNSGAVGINTQTQTNGAMLNLGYTAGTTTGISIVSTNSSGGYPMAIYNGSSTLLGYISTDGTSSVVYNTTSDRRLKENIKATARGLDDLMKINIEDFNFINDPSKKRVQGFIAQDVYNIYPEAVTVGGDDANANPWAVDYGRLSPLIVRAVQQQQEEIVALKKEIEALKGNSILTTTSTVALNAAPARLH